MIPIDEPAPEERLPANKRLRVDLIVAAIVLAGILLVGRAISGRHGSPGASGSPTPSHPSSSARAITFPAPSSVYVTGADGQRRLVPALPLRTKADPAACPVRVSCFSEQGGPGTMLAPVLDRFTDARVLSVHSVRLRDRPWVGSLWFRQLDFRVAGGELLVRIVASTPDSRADSGRVGGQLFVRTTLQQYDVTIQAAAATGVGLADLRRIAADDRLLTT